MWKMGAEQAWLVRVVVLGTALGCSAVDQPRANRAGTELVIPLDERPAVTSSHTVLPISGGTLSVMKDGSAAIASDPERDNVSVVDLATLSVRHVVALQPGDQPGRSVEDSDRHVHVVLRGGGAVVSIDPSTGVVTNRRAVCKAPRGIAFDATTGLLHVACAEGTLVSLPAQGGEVARTLSLEPDLRDVMVRGSELWVTRFKSAELLHVSSVGLIAGRETLPSGSGLLSQAADRSLKPLALSPGVAWRAVPTADGGAVVVHQLAVVDDVLVEPPGTSRVPNVSSYGGDAVETCDGIVKNVISTIAGSGQITSVGFGGSPLPVDIAVSPDQRMVAVAHAGPVEQELPRPHVIFTDASGFALTTPGFSVGSGISVLAMSAGGASNCLSPNRKDFREPVTAVAFGPDGRLYAQTREPAQFLVLPLDSVNQPALPGPATLQVVALPGESRLDTGHDLFHRDSGGGIACASCHPEGGEDGHTWHFTDTGARRTQALNVGLSGTAPFHWSGDLPDVSAVMSEIFVGRMGGIRQTPARVDALSSWLFSLARLPAIRDVGDPAAVRGRTLFEATSVGCASCHTGEKFTNNETVAIDTARDKLQVPSLVAIGYRSPFMHDGCAATLSTRFNPACGGNSHGDTSALTPDQLGDLIAYLEAL